MTRDRGSYGSSNKHPFLDWGAGHAKEFVRDHTIGAALRPVMPTVSDVFRAGRGAEQWWKASRAIGGRGEAEKPAVQIGQELFHTVADRERAILALSTGFKAIVNDLAVWQMSNKDRPEASATAQWLAADVTPTIEEWSQFVEHERKSWWTKIATSWETFESWWDRLKQLRSVARAHGVALQSAEPLPLPKTIWQKSSEGKGSEAVAILGVLKIGVLTAAAILGAASLYAAVRNLKLRAHDVNEQEALRQVVRQELRNVRGK